MNHACKQDFHNLEHLSRFHNHILIVMIFRHFSFEVCFVTIIKNDVIKMKYVIRVKPFDVLIKNRMANMTLVVLPPDSLTNPRSDEEKGDTLLTKRTIDRRKLST